MVVANDKLTLFNGFALDRARGCLTHSGESVHLRPQTYRVLQYLADNDGQLISKDVLIDAVWEGRAVTDGAVGKCIEELRSVFGEEGRQYLRNVRGRGYIFDREPQPVFHTVRETHSEEIDVVRVIVEENGKSETAVHHSDKTGSRWISTTSLTVIAGVFLVALIGVYWFSTVRQPATSITSIAVLPLKNETGNAELDYLSDGMTESLIGRLSRLQGMTVKSRSAVFQYKGKDQDAHTVASDLSVQALLSGRFLQRGDEVTLYVSLIDGRTGNQIWGEQYNRKLNQLASLERETATDVATQLNSKLRPTDQARLTRGSTVNSEAYLTYLKGRYYWNNPGRGYGKSVEFFQKAIDLDPTFSLGYAGLGHYYGYAAATGRLPPDENWRRSESAVKKALELDDGVAETHNALAGVQLYDYRDWKAAESSFRRGVELNLTPPQQKCAGITPGVSSSLVAMMRL
jgi:TolB-like protein/DNA-binding winged helix-turn-helix (wHTH) protein